MSDDDSENHKEEEQRQVEIKKRDKSGERFCGNIKDGDDDYDDENHDDGDNEYGDDDGDDDNKNTMMRM